MSALKFARPFAEFVKSIYTDQIRNMSGFLPLKAVVSKLEDFAPLKLAEAWDNVGLLIEPSSPKDVKTIFLSNDLTEVVLQEAIDKHSDLIICYHPPIFSPLKRITQSTWKERLVAICLEHRIALYSPHTCWDSVPHGVNDWLASSLPFSSSVPLQPHKEIEYAGMGRFLTLKENITLQDAIDKVKLKTGIKTVQVSIGNQSSLTKLIKTAAICAGSGASLFKNVEADLYISGEMSHHEVLDAQQRNVSVILCNHSNSERGYLKEFKNHLNKLLIGSVKIFVTETDVDPLFTH